MTYVETEKIKIQQNKKDIAFDIATHLLLF